MLYYIVYSIKSWIFYYVQYKSSIIKKQFNNKKSLLKLCTVDADVAENEIQ